MIKTPPKKFAKLMDTYNFYSNAHRERDIGHANFPDDSHLIKKFSNKNYIEKPRLDKMLNYFLADFRVEDGMDFHIGFDSVDTFESLLITPEDIESQCEFEYSGSQQAILKTKFNRYGDYFKKIEDFLRLFRIRADKLSAHHITSYSYYGSKYNALNDSDAFSGALSDLTLIYETNLEYVGIRTNGALFKVIKNQSYCTISLSNCKFSFSSEQPSNKYYLVSVPKWRQSTNWHDMGESIFSKNQMIFREIQLGEEFTIGTTGINQSWLDGELTECIKEFDCSLFYEPEYEFEIPDKDDGNAE